MYASQRVFEIIKISEMIKLIKFFFNQ